MRPLLRYAAVAALVAVLFAVGTDAEPVHMALTRLWDAMLPAGLRALLHQGTSPELTRKSLPAMLTYGLLYCGLCLALIGLLRGTRRRLGWALAVYGLGFLVCGLLLGLGVLAHQSWAYPLARRLIDGLVSPLPVVGLVPLLYWYEHPAPHSP